MPDDVRQKEGLFFDKGEMDTLLLKRSEERRGFFRSLTGL